MSLFQKRELDNRWAKYRRRFASAARRSGYDREYVKRCLDYAEPLFLHGAPIIYSQDHLSKLVGYNIEYLRRYSNDPSVFYRTYYIKKKSGGYRRIDEPLPSLKEIQRWVLENILYKMNTHICAKAFKKGGNIRDNARFHRKQSFVISLDVKNFFNSLSARKIYKLFYRIGYCEPVAVMLTKLCTLRGVLPQGAPTSPALSNILVARIDSRIFGFTRKHALRYTRYADDITISAIGEFRHGRIIKFVRKVLEDENLELNEKKTRVMYRHQRQEVTGVVVNEKIQAPREVRRKIRANRYYIEKYGIDSHTLYQGITKRHYIEHIMGIANFVLFLDRNNTDARKLIEILSKR